LVLLGAITLFPALFVLARSLFDFDQSNPAHIGDWVGLSNYAQLAADPAWWNAVRVTLTIIFVGVPLQLLLGLLLALFVERNLHGSRVVTSLLLVPLAIAPITVGLGWRLFLNADYGVVPYLFRSMGVNFPGPLLGTPATALPTIIFIQTWMWTPFMTLVLLAGLRAVPREPLEAATVDGASPFRVLIDVTLPLMRPIVLVAVLLRSIDAFQIFDEVYILTGGGPGNSTEATMLYAFRVNFSYFNTGYGAAIAVVMAAMTLFGAAVVYRLVRPRW